MEKILLALASLARSTAIYEESQAISKAKEALNEGILQVIAQRKRQTVPNLDLGQLIDLLLVPHSLWTHRYLHNKHPADKSPAKPKPKNRQGFVELMQSGMSFLLGRPPKTNPRLPPDPVPNDLEAEPNQNHPSADVPADSADGSANDLVSDFLSSILPDQEKSPGVVPLSVLEKVSRNPSFPKRASCTSARSLEPPLVLSKGMRIFTKSWMEPYFVRERKWPMRSPRSIVPYKKPF